MNYPCKYYLASAFSYNTLEHQCVQSKRSELRWTLGTLLIIVYFAFLVYGGYQHSRDFHKAGVLDVTIHVIFLMAYFVCLIEKLNYIGCRKFYIPTVNSFLTYIQEVQGCKYVHINWYIFFKTITTNGIFEANISFVYNNLALYGRSMHGSKHQKQVIAMIELLLKMLIAIMFTMPLVFLVLYVRTPTSSIFFSSLFSNHGITFKILYCPIALLHMFLLGSMIAEITFNSIITIVPIIFSISVFSAFRYKNFVTYFYIKMYNGL